MSEGLTCTTTEDSERSSASHTHSADAMLSLRVARYRPSTLQDMIFPTPSLGFGFVGSGRSTGIGPGRAGAYVMSTSLLELRSRVERVCQVRGEGGEGEGNAEGVVRVEGGGLRYGRGPWISPERGVVCCQMIRAICERGDG